MTTPHTNLSTDTVQFVADDDPPSLPPIFVTKTRLDALLPDARLIDLLASSSVPADRS